MLAYLRKVTRRAEDRGASAVEYGLMVAAIAAVIVLAVFTLGSNVKTAFETTNTKLCAQPGLSCTTAPAGTTGP
jgi:pilus assembly protein Flp/PilA